MNHIFIIVAIATIVIIVAIILGIYFGIKSHKRESTYDKAKRMYNDITSKNPPSGLLAQTLGLRDLQPIIENQGETEMLYFCSCSPNTDRKACSPWLYLRKDLSPMTFIFPGLGLFSPQVGVLLDITKMYDMIGTMALVDADSNNGSCCTNSAGQIDFTSIETQEKEDAQKGTWPCIYYLRQKYNVPKDATLFIAGDNAGTPAWTPGSAPVVCPQCNNETIPVDRKTYLCQINQAGAGINTWDMLQFWPQCDDEFINCFTITKVSDKNQYEIKIKDDPVCQVCKQPFVCVTEDPPAGSQWPHIKIENDLTSGYIGKDGMGYFSSYTALNNGYFDTGNTAVRQCKFQLKDWDIWIKVQREFYRKYLEIMNPDNSYKSDGMQQFLANPDNGTYLEHEINIYVDPEHSSKFYKAQNKRFTDSIIGFFYTSTTCEEQLKAVDKIPTTSWKSTYNNSEERCDGFFANSPDPVSQKLTGADRRAAEKSKILQERIQVLALCDAFKKYYGREIMPLKAQPHSNAFVNYNALQNVLDKKQKFEDIFQVIKPTNTDKQLLDCWANKRAKQDKESNLTDKVTRSLNLLTECVESHSGKPAVNMSVKPVYTSPYRN